MSNARVNEAQAEVERLRAERDNYNTLYIERFNEVERLRAELNLLKMGPAGSAFALEAEVERLKETVLRRNQGNRALKREVTELKGEVTRLRAALKSEKEGEVCYGDFVGECFRVGRVPCSECEAWNRRP